MLHLRCGTDILDKLDAAGVPGWKVSWSDCLCEGPWPPGPRDAVRPVRARYLAQGFDLPEPDVLRDLEAADAALEAAAAEDEVVLWFEHDLYDQPILCWLLTCLAPLAARVRVSLVQVHEHPSVARFIGLGQLAPKALGELFPRRVAVAPGTFALAECAVRAWTAPEPGALAALRAPDAALPHLAAAVARYLEEYPGEHDGLACSERMALQAVAGGAATARQAFAQVQAREPRPWMGDAMLFARLRVLAEGPAPLLEVSGEWRADDDPALALTATGRRVLAGVADWRHLAPWERWMGGVRLAPGGPDWRWSEGRDEVVRVD